MAKCAATTQDGSPCQNEALEGSNFCHVHQPDEGPAQGGEFKVGFGMLLLTAMVLQFAVYVLVRFLQQL